MGVFPHIACCSELHLCSDRSRSSAWFVNSNQNRHCTDWMDPGDSRLDRESTKSWRVNIQPSRVHLLCQLRLWVRWRVWGKTTENTNTEFICRFRIPGKRENILNQSDLEIERIDYFTSKYCCYLADNQLRIFNRRMPFESCWKLLIKPSGDRLFIHPFGFNETVDLCRDVDNLVT